MLQPILLLHGALGTKEQFSKLIPLLEPSFDVHTFDFSGHGENVSSLRTFNMETFAYEIGGLLICLMIFGLGLWGILKVKNVMNKMIFINMVGIFFLLMNSLIVFGIISGKI